MKTIRTFTLYLVATLWMLVAMIGMAGLWDYASTPAQAMSAPSRLPGDGTVFSGDNRTLVMMFIHPKCPCTSSSIAELATVIPAVGARTIDLRIIVVKPMGAPADWAESSTVRAAAALPSAMVVLDTNGAIARRFHATTSGEVVVYSKKHDLVFQGGITAARGHLGANAGVDSLESIFQNGNATTPTTATFGCPLFSEVCGTDTESCPY